MQSDSSLTLLCLQKIQLQYIIDTYVNTTVFIFSASYVEHRYSVIFHHLKLFFLPLQYFNSFYKPSCLIPLLYPRLYISDTYLESKNNSASRFIRVHLEFERNLLMSCSKKSLKTIKLLIKL